MALCAVDAAAMTYGGALKGATAFSLDLAGNASAAVAAMETAAVFSEVHASDTVPLAVHAAHGAVYKHAYRQQVWLADPVV